MVHEIKNIETKKLTRLGIIIRLGVWLVSLAAFVTFINHFVASVSVVAGVYLGYKVFRLLIRLIGQTLSIIFTVIAILILISIISLIII